jgi:hypothetical protein
MSEREQGLRPFDVLYRLRDYLFHAVDCPDNGYAAGGGGGACICGLDEAWDDGLALLAARPAADHTRRWNMEETERGVRLCRGEHGKNEGCEWEEYEPARPAAEERAERLGLMVARLTSALAAIAQMPEIDQDDAHRLRHKAARALATIRGGTDAE